MRVRTLLATAALAAIVSMAASLAFARAAMPVPAYMWAFRADVVVRGRVETVGDGSAVLRITKTLAGKVDGDSLTFHPIGHPECWVVKDRAVDVAPGDDVALFLTREGLDFRVLDGGYAKLHLHGRRAWMSAPLESVERLVAMMRTADLDARDRGMIASATADEELLRRAACNYVREDLGVASPRGDRSGPPDAAADEAHLAAVRRLAVPLAALVRRENGSEPCGAALDALDAADVAPEGAFDDFVKFARVIDRSESQFDAACRVIARYDLPEAAVVLTRFAMDRPDVLVSMGASRNPAVRRELLAEFHGMDDLRVLAAAAGLARILERGFDEEIEDAFLSCLEGDVGPTLESRIGWALRGSRPLEVANLVLDKLASESLSKEGEEAGAGLLYDYLRAGPPIPGLRELVVKRQAVITDRLAAGRTEATRPLHLLSQLRTPEALAALRSAAESHPDPDIRNQAKWRAERFGE